MTNSTDAASPFGFTVEHHGFDYVDPYADGDLEAITAEVAALTELANTYYGPGATDRKRTTAIDFANPATSRLTGHAVSIRAWLDLVPSAAALHPIYEPEVESFTSGAAVCEEIRPWFRNLADAHGIRSRAAVMKEILVRDARGAATPQTWLFLACGAAQPLFEALQTLHDGGHAVHATLADLDRDALRLAEEYARSHDLEKSMTTVRMNVLNRRRIDRPPRWNLARPATWREAYDVVDAVGLLEYLKADDWTYTYNGLIKTRRPMAGATTFLRNAFACVKPGGKLVVGNMLDTHPQRDFILNVCQWPHVQPRSVDAMLDIFASAELDGHVDVYRPSDGVYAVYVVHKHRSR